MEEQQVVEEGEQTAEPAAAAAPKRGETPRQQIRKAKAVSRRQFSAEDKIRIVMEGIRGDISVSELCRRERVHTTVVNRHRKVTHYRRPKLTHPEWCVSASEASPFWS